MGAHAEAPAFSVLGESGLLEDEGVDEVEDTAANAIGEALSEAARQAGISGEGEWSLLIRVKASEALGEIRLVAVLKRDPSWDESLAGGLN